MFSFVLAMVCATMAWENRGHRRCILDSSNKEYSFYENDHLTYVGTFNNIYIRLKEQKYGKIKDAGAKHLAWGWTSPININKGCPHNPTC